MQHLLSCIISTVTPENRQTKETVHFHHIKKGKVWMNFMIDMRPEYIVMEAFETSHFLSTRNSLTTTTSTTHTFTDRVHGWGRRLITALLLSVVISSNSASYCTSFAVLVHAGRNGGLLILPRLCCETESLYSSTKALLVCFQAQFWGVCSPSFPPK